VVSVMPWTSFSPPEMTTSIQWTGGCVGHRVSLDTEVRRKILFPQLGIEPRSPGRPVRSQTLYWLNYPGSCRIQMSLKYFSEETGENHEIIRKACNLVSTKLIVMSVSYRVKDALVV
jgi:hypothetical protein